MRYEATPPHLHLWTGRTFSEATNRSARTLRGQPERQRHPLHQPGADHDLDQVAGGCVALERGHSRTASSRPPTVARPGSRGAEKPSLPSSRYHAWPNRGVKDGEGLGAPSPWRIVRELEPGAISRSPATTRHAVGVAQFPEVQFHSRPGHIRHLGPPRRGGYSPRPKLDKPGPESPRGAPLARLRACATGAKP
jgi:hypothetical protein